MTMLDLQPLIRRAQELAALIDAESERLLVEPARDLATLVDEKRQLANAFNHAVRQIVSQREALKATPKEAREALKDALEALDTSVIRNSAILLRLKDQVEGLLEAVALEQAPMQAQTYAPGKAMPPRTKTSLAINASV